MTEIGHNAKEQLKSIIERVENREVAKAEIGEEIKDIYTEAKSGGYDVKALRTIVRIRKQSPEDRANQEEVLETYMHALGMV